MYTSDSRFFELNILYHKIFVHHALKNNYANAQTIFLLVIVRWHHTNFYLSCTLYTSRVLGSHRGTEPRIAIELLSLRI